MELDDSDQNTGDIIVTGETLGSATITVTTAERGQKPFTVTVYNTGPGITGSIPPRSLPHKVLVAVPRPQCLMRQSTSRGKTLSTLPCQVMTLLR